jgi:cytochrome c peroxidase
MVGVAVGALGYGMWPAAEHKPGAVGAAAHVATARTLLPRKAEYGTTQPLPQRIDLDMAKVTLGERLFHDARLSGNDTISCASCHNLATGGVDRQPRSFGMNNAEGAVNAPTVFNSGFNFAQFWDGRAATLEAQIDGPIHSPKEMATNWPQVVAKLAADQTYPALFTQSYADGISSTNIKDAIATFERALVTPNSRFDRYLRGEADTLSPQEKQGYVLFRSYGCSSCHQGINLGGNMFQKMGLMGDYFADRGHVTEADRGRYNVDHRPDSMHAFKVPSLRNVALTAPYFHDGSARTLSEAIAIMAKYQLGRPMPAADLKAIAAFLETLTGEYRGKPL